MKISKVACVIFNIWIAVLFAWDIYRGNYDCAMLLFGIWAMFMLNRLAQKDAAKWEGEYAKLTARHMKLLKELEADLVKIESLRDCIGDFIDEAYPSKPQWVSVAKEVMDYESWKEERG